MTIQGKHQSHSFGSYQVKIGQTYMYQQTSSLNTKAVKEDRLFPVMPP